MATDKVSQTDRNSQQSTFLHILDALPQPLLARAFPVSGKRPAVKGWQRPNPRPSTVARYRARFPSVTGCGIRTGDGQDGPLAVLDVDHPNELTEYQADVLESWPWTVATRRGWHCYGKPPLETVKTIKTLRWGDYLAESAYVVAPGSAHSDGGRYMALPGFGQGELPTFCPELLESLLSPSPGPAFPGGRGDSSKRNDLSTIGPMLARLESALLSAPIGQRNTALFLALAHWSYQQSQPYDPREWAALVGQRAAVYAARLPTRRGFPDSEIRKLARSVSSWTWGKTFQRPAPDATEKRMLQLVGAESRRARNAGRDSRIIELRAAGLSYRRIAVDVGVNESTAFRVVRRGGQIGATPAELSRALSVGQ